MCYLVLYQLNYLPENIILFSIGTGFGYVLHISQKMLVFNEIMEDAIKEQAQIAVGEETEKEVKKQVDKTTSEKLDEQIEKKVEEKEKDVEKVIDDKIDKDSKIEREIEEQVEKRVKEEIKNKDN